MYRSIPARLALIVIAVLPQARPRSVQTHGYPWSHCWGRVWYTCPAERAASELFTRLVSRHGTLPLELTLETLCLLPVCDRRVVPRRRALSTLHALMSCMSENPCELHVPLVILTAFGRSVRHTRCRDTLHVFGPVHGVCWFVRQTIGAATALQALQDCRRPPICHSLLTSSTKI